MSPTQTDGTVEYRRPQAGESRSNGAEFYRLGGSRRGFLRAIGGVATVGMIAGCLDGLGAADDGDYSDTFDEDGDPEYGDWFDDVDTYDGTVDARDETEVAIAVGANGGLAFDPPAILIEPGTTVVWEWTGDGGAHDVAHVDGAFESELTGDSAHTFEHTFDESGIYRYVCNPHRQAGMKGAVAVPDGGNEDAENASNHTGSQ